MLSRVCLATGLEWSTAVVTSLTASVTFATLLVLGMVGSRNQEIEGPTRLMGRPNCSMPRGEDNLACCCRAATERDLTGAAGCTKERSLWCLKPQHVQRSSPMSMSNGVSLGMPGPAATCSNASSDRRYCRSLLCLSKRGEKGCNRCRQVGNLGPLRTDPMAGASKMRTRRG